MKKVFVSLFVVLLVFSNSFAQKDPKAKEVLDQVSVKIKSFSSIKARFTNKMDNAQEKISETLEGTLFLKGKKYKMEAMGMTTFCDGVTKWVYMPESNEVNISDVSKMTEEEKSANLLADPSQIFTMYEKGFKYQFIEEYSEKGKNLVLIELVPEDKDKPFFKIKLVIDKGAMVPQSLHYFGKEGTKYFVEIKEFTPNTKMEDAMFTFNPAKYAGVEVIDMRE